MKNVSKVASKQDCNYAINQGNSNETSIKLTEEMVSMFDLPKPDNQQYDVTLKIFRDDLYKMLAYIVSNLPLYDKKGELVYFSVKFYNNKLTEISDFFGKDDSKDYPVKLLNNKSRSACIQGFPSGLNIRDFLVENYTKISFVENGQVVEMHLAPTNRAIGKAENSPIDERKKNFKQYLYTPGTFDTTGTPGKYWNHVAVEQYMQRIEFVWKILSDILGHDTKNLFELADVKLAEKLYNKVKQDPGNAYGNKLASAVCKKYLEFLKGPSKQSSGEFAIEFPELPLQMITYGAPGTGKSFITDLECQKYQKEQTVRTTFHPDTDYASFVGAYKPTKDEDGNITYEFVPQHFMQAYIKAWKDRTKPVFLIIEEINRGNCAQIFGDIFQLLDRNEDGLSTYAIVPDKDIKKFIIDSQISAEEIYNNAQTEDISDKISNGDLMLLPSNLYIWATMNTSDQSLFPMDSAFKRRWEWKYVKIAEGVKRDSNNVPEKDANGKPIPLKWQIELDKDTKVDWWRFVCAINARIPEMTDSADKQLGYFFSKAKDGIISAEMFVSKVIFYLWNDVFKLSGFEDTKLFTYTEKDAVHTITFPDFYNEDNEVNTKVLKHFVMNVLNYNVSDDKKVDFFANSNEENQEDNQSNNNQAE